MTAARLRCAVCFVCARLVPAADCVACNARLLPPSPLQSAAIAPENQCATCSTTSGCTACAAGAYRTADCWCAAGRAAASERRRRASCDLACAHAAPSHARDVCLRSRRLTYHLQEFANQAQCSTRCDTCELCADTPNCSSTSGCTTCVTSFDAEGLEFTYPRLKTVIGGANIGDANVCISDLCVAGLARETGYWQLFRCARLGGGAGAGASGGRAHRESLCSLCSGRCAGAGCQSSGCCAASLMSALLQALRRSQPLW